MSILTTIAFVFVLGLVIFIHELGHFVAAKLSGVKVEEFAFGWGPQLVGKEYKGTLYRLNLLPIGGYVKMLGEESPVEEKGSYSAAPKHKRFCILIAGVAMNLVLASVLYTIFLAINSFTIVIPKYTSYEFHGAHTQEVYYITDIVAGSAAEKSGLKPGDVIAGIDETSFSSVADFQAFVKAHPDTEAEVTLVNIYGDDRKAHTLTIGKNDKGEGSLGISLMVSDQISYRGASRIWSGAVHSANMIATSVSFFKDLIVYSFKTKDPTILAESVSGPVGVYAATDIVLKAGGIVGLIDMAALISASLAFMNLLPFPALDGGHIFLLIIEAIRGKKLNPKIEGWVIGAGFIALMGFSLIITAKDLFQFGVIDWLIFWK